MRLYDIRLYSAFLFVAMGWTIIVIRRLGKDIEEVKTSDIPGKLAIILIWTITVIILIAVILIGYHAGGYMVSRLIYFFKNL